MPQPNVRVRAFAGIVVLALIPCAASLPARREH
jgi:hypothetical protein